MNKVTEVALCVIVVFLQSISFGSEVTGKEIHYQGVDTVTAAVALSKNLIVVGSAEDNVLRIYRLSAPSAPLASIELSKHLNVDPALPIVIAGAAKVRNRIYWISSHSRDEFGRERPERYRFFATSFAEKNGRVQIEPVGKSCKILFHKLVNLKTVRTLRLSKATRFGESLNERDRRKLNPVDDGLNIGALCASHNSKMLYIALQNPRPIRVTTGRPHAVIVPLDNPDGVLENHENPIFGEGMLWDLQGLGIVGFEYSPAHRKYFVVAAPHGVQGSIAVYSWSGMKTHPPELMTFHAGKRTGFLASTLVPFENRNRVLFLGKQTKNLNLSNNSTSGSHTATFSALWYQP